MESLCGLRCDHCGAWKAQDDPARRERTAETWAIKYNLSLKPGELSCPGCINGTGLLISQLWKKYGPNAVSLNCKECVANGKQVQCLPCRIRECGSCHVRRAPFFKKDGTVDQGKFDTFKKALAENSEIRGLFGSHLRLVRKAAGLTLQDLAARCGISLQYLSEIERGIKNPPLTTLVTISDALRMPVADLFAIPELQQDGIGELLARVKHLPRAEQDKITEFLKMMVGD